MSKMTSVEVPATTNYRWVMLAVYYLGALAFGVVFQSIPALLPLMIVDLQLSYTESGSLMSLFALLGIALALPVGVMADRRYGGRTIVIAAYTLMIVGTLVVAAATSYPMLLVGRLISGAGGISLSVVLARLVSHWFKGKDLGKAMGFFTTGMPVATILSLSFLGDFARGAGWPTAVLIGVAITAVALVALLLFYREAPAHQVIPAEPVADGALWKKTITIGLPIWLVGLIWMWYNAAVLSFLTFGPDYFYSKGFGLGFAGFLASLLMLGSLIIAPIVGYLLDRYRQPELSMGVGGIIIALSIMLIPASTSFVVVPLAILSIGAALVPTTVLYMPSKVVRPQDTGLAFGIINLCLTASIIVGPFLVGLARDISGTYESGFTLMAGFAVLCSVTAGILKIFGTRSLEG